MTERQFRWIMSALFVVAGGVAMPHAVAFPSFILAGVWGFLAIRLEAPVKTVE